MDATVARQTVPNLVWVVLVLLVGVTAVAAATGLWVLTAVPIGFLFGFFLHKGDLCGASACSEVVLMRDGRKLFGVWVVIVVSMLGFAALDLVGWVSLSPKPMLWLTFLVGGAIFGVGTVLAGGCISGCLFKAGGGNLNSMAGLVGALLAGGALGLFHGWLSIKYKTNQIVSGTVINIFALGMTSFISALFLQRQQELNHPPIFPTFAIPLLSKIPVIGPIAFLNNPFVYAMFVLLIVIHTALFFTRWGLRHRSVGEHPKAADTLGINVFRTRYVAVVLGGMMAGFAGAYYTLGSVGRFDEVMTAGRGFIGLAAMIFGNWTPFGAFGASLLFGFADALSSKLAILGIAIPSQFLLMTPYIATMVVLAGVVGRSQMPAADGVPYEKE